MCCWSESDVDNNFVSLDLEEEDGVSQTQTNHCNAQTKVTIVAQATLDEAGHAHSNEKACREHSVQEGESFCSLVWLGDV